MAFNIGAAIGGAAEEIARGMQEKTARLVKLTDDAWDDHKNTFQRKREAEEAKAIVYEETIKAIKGLEGVESIDQAAAIYSKLGTDEQARDWLSGAQTLTAFGGNLQEMGYISAMPDDFEASGMTAKEYAQTFTNAVRFGEGLGEGTRVEGRLQTRYDQMAGMGLAPADYTPAEVTYAQVEVDPSLRGSQVSLAASREMLTTQLGRLEAGSPQADAVQQALDNLNDAEMKALGGKVDSSAQAVARKLYRSLITDIGEVVGAEKSGMDITTDASGDRTFTLNNKDTYGKWIRTQIPSMLEQQKELLPAKEYQAFEVYVNALLADTSASEVIDEVSPKAVPKGQGSVKMSADTSLTKAIMLSQLNEGVSYEDLKAAFMENEGADEALFETIYTEITGQPASHRKIYGPRAYTPPDNTGQQ